MIKTNYNTKITGIGNKLGNHNYGKYIDTSKFNILAANVFNARLAQANLITKTDFDTKLSSLNKKITKNKADHLIVRNEINKIKDFDFGSFFGKSHFEEDGVQNYLVFQLMYKYLRLIILIIFHPGHLKDCLIKVSCHLLQLIIFLLFH